MLRLERLWKSLKNLKKKSNRCKYASICDKYREDSYVCNREGGGVYCGQYRLFEERKALVKVCAKCGHPWKEQKKCPYCGSSRYKVIIKKR